MLYIISIAVSIVVVVSFAVFIAHTRAEKKVKDSFLQKKERMCHTLQEIETALKNAEASKTISSRLRDNMVTPCITQVKEWLESADPAKKPVRMLDADASGWLGVLNTTKRQMADEKAALEKSQSLVPSLLGLIPGRIEDVRLRISSGKQSTKAEIRLDTAHQKYKRILETLNATQTLTTDDWLWIHTQIPQIQSDLVEAWMEHATENGYILGSHPHGANFVLAPRLS